MKKNHALIAIIATASAIGAVVILIRSAMKNSEGQTDMTAIIIAVALMSLGVVLAHYVKKQRKDQEVAAELGTDKPIDHEFEQLVDSFYALSREEEFYSCLENGGPIEDFSVGVKNFRKTRENALGQGSTEYIWRTSRDQDVCLRCRRNNGKHFAWKDLINGDHPGCSPGCRCKAEPVLPQEKSRTPVRAVHKTDNLANPGNLNNPNRAAN